MANPIDIFARQALAFDAFMNGRSMVKAAADHDVPLIVLEAMVRNNGNENITELATEVARQLGSEHKVDIDFIFRWILSRLVDDLPMDDLVSVFSFEHELPSKKTAK